LAKDLNLLTTIHFFGRLKHSDAMRILARCDIATQPDPKNDFNDSCTMVKSLECMALGKPLVAFELLETYEICADAALYAEPNSFAAFAEKIVALADDPALRRRLGSTGRHRISTSLNWQLEKKALLQAYAKLGATELGVET
jgi:glycosyltransferase involved in cell wall biosynthesis